jgi:hypothetical protein
MMRQSVVWPALLLAIICFAGVLAAQNTGKTSSEFPRYFNPEDEDRGFAHAGPPSDAVLNALLEAEEVKASTSDLEGLSREELRKRFRAVRISLSSEQEQDYLAQGLGKLTGADCDWFWIIRVKRGRAQLLLFVNGLSVTVLQHMTNGYSDIRGDWATAGYTGMGIFRYDGHVYRRALQRTAERKP